MTLYEAVDVYRHSTRPALYFRSRTVRHDQFLRRVDHMASVLYDLGVRKDSVVSLLSPNLPEAIVSLYACNKIGAVVATLHPLLPPLELKEALEENHSAFLLLIDARYPAYEDVLKEVKVKTYFLSALKDLRPIERPFFRMLYRGKRKDIPKERYLYSYRSSTSFPVNRDDHKPSLYLRSGGTTGKSKTVVLNDAAVNYVTSKSAFILGRNPSGKSMIGLLPLFHGFGLTMGVHAPLSNDAASCLMIGYDGDEICRKIAQGKLNILITIPYMTEKLLKNRHFRGRKLRNLIVTYIGADKPEEKLFDAFDRRMEEAKSPCRLREGYGMTETISVNFVNTDRNHRRGSVGKPLPGTSVRIVSLEDNSREVPVGQDGQIVVSSPSLFLGYLGVEKEKLPVKTDQSGARWLYTGDIGHLDEGGYLYFRSRKTDVEKIAGFYVYPSAIEEEAGKVPGVKDAAAVYVPKAEHPYFVLYVEPENPETDPKKLEEALRQALSLHLIRYSVPEKIVFQALPRTSIGKIDRKKLVQESRAS